MTPAPPIVPRWEWRTFGDRFGEADSRFASLAPDRVQESDEVYLLSLASDASVKVRDGLMDVKRLERTNDDGLEQWKPVMKATYPLSGADIAAVLEALGITVPVLARSEYTLDELVAEVIEPSDDLAAVAVHKRREHYTICGSMAELSEVRTAQGSRRTIAVESEDAARVSAGVRELGLGSRRNVNMARGLKALVGFGARRYAVIDVGTNSVKFHVGERAADGEWRTIVDRAVVTRLGEGLDEAGLLESGSMERTIEAIAAMAAEAGREGADAIAAVGTAGLRRASNGASFLDAVRQRSGVEIEVISGEEEGRLAYVAATSRLGVGGGGSLVVFDSGGGSTQLTFGDGEHVDERFSLNVGAVGITERFGLDRRRLRGDARRRVRRDRDRACPARRPVDTGDPGRHGRNRHEPRRHQACACDLRSRCRPGDRARPSGGRSSDRALPHPRGRRATRDCRPPARARRSHPGRRVHRPNHS